MIYDRFGYFGKDGYQFWPDILAGGKFYGLNPFSQIYRSRRPFEQGRVTCPACHSHDHRDRRFPCDVAKARAADMEAEGIPATFCYSCSREMPVRSGQHRAVPKCFRCERHQAERRRPVIQGGTVRVPDGAGCSERLPVWMVDANYGRGE